MRYTLLYVLLIPSLAAAEIYRWTDAEGRVHFSERPQAGAEPVQVRPQVVERDAATREREERAARYFDARRDEQAQAASRVADAREKRQKACENLRSQKEQLDRGGSFFRVDERGERQYYSDEQIETFRRSLAEALNRDCR